jgi:heme/copper-type cytochrome/quinol oxidase subunit 2
MSYLSQPVNGTIHHNLNHQGDHTHNLETKLVMVIYAIIFIYFLNLIFLYIMVIFDLQQKKKQNNTFKKILCSCEQILCTKY